MKLFWAIKDQSGLVTYGQTPCLALAPSASAAVGRSPAPPGLAHVVHVFLTPPDVFYRPLSSELVLRVRQTMPDLPGLAQISVVHQGAEGHASVLVVRAGDASMVAKLYQNIKEYL